MNIQSTSIETGSDSKEGMNQQIKHFSGVVNKFTTLFYLITYLNDIKYDMELKKTTLDIIFKNKQFVKQALKFIIYTTSSGMTILNALSLTAETTSFEIKIINLILPVVIGFFISISEMYASTKLLTTIKKSSYQYESCIKNIDSFVYSIKDVKASKNQNEINKTLNSKFIAYITEQNIILSAESTHYIKNISTNNDVQKYIVNKCKMNPNSKLPLREYMDIETRRELTKNYSSYFKEREIDASEEIGTSDDDVNRRYGVQYPITDFSDLDDGLDKKIQGLAKLKNEHNFAKIANDNVAKMSTIINISDDDCTKGSTDAAEPIHY
jgi:hypothetical protein